ncbi:MAG: hypothetical protein C4345_01460 [Chloroflexota bacterium]
MVGTADAKIMSKEMAMELRKCPRYIIQFPVSFSGEESAGAGTAYNLSTGGCAVESELHMYLPDYDPPIAVDLAAVRWLRCGSLV